MECGTTLGAIYVAEPGDDVWTPGLGDVEIVSGGEVDVMGSVGKWDLLIVDSGGAEMMRVHNVQFAEGTVIALSD